MNLIFFNLIPREFEKINGRVVYALSNAYNQRRFVKKSYFNGVSMECISRVTIVKKKKKLERINGRDVYIFSNLCIIDEDSRRNFI